MVSKYSATSALNLGEYLRENVNTHLLTVAVEASVAGCSKETNNNKPYWSAGPCVSV